MARVKKEELRTRWSNPATRGELLDALKDAGFAEDRLKDIQKLLECTQFDLLDVMLELVYGVGPLTRAWRAEHLKTELERMTPTRRAFAEVVLSKYVEDGVWSLGRATLVNYIKMKFGSVQDAMRNLDCDNPEKVADFYDGLQEKLYSEG